MDVGRCRSVLLQFSVLLIVFASLPRLTNSSESSCQAAHIGLHNTTDLLLPIALISDQDRKSKGHKSWFSIIKHGALAMDKARKSAFVHWTGERKVTSYFNYNEKGMEMSDLKVFNNKLLSIDDKLGIVFSLRNQSALPWVISPGGDGTSEKPFKGEWMTIKDDELYIGSSGHEVVTNQGEYINDDEMFIRIFTKKGEMRIEDWTSRYVKIRAAAGIHFPGYIIHEAAQWSNVHKKWFFLPRYASKIVFHQETAHEMGSNLLITSSENFDEFSVKTIGDWHAHRGFSAFQFVPGTQDDLITAIKSIEVPTKNNEKHMATYITVFSINGTILLNDILVQDNIKFEGLEFVDIQNC